jgi:hypothetical protein
MMNVIILSVVILNVVEPLSRKYPTMMLMVAIVKRNSCKKRLVYRINSSLLLKIFFCKIYKHHNLLINFLNEISHA